MLLNEVIDTISQTYDFSTVKSVVFLNTSDVFDGKILHSSHSKPNILPGQAKKRIKNGDILFSEIRPANRRFALVQVHNPEEYVVSTKLMVLRVKSDKFDPLFVYHYLTQDTTLRKLQILAESRSGTFPQITFSEIQSLEIPHYSLIKQRHIVDTVC